MIELMGAGYVVDYCVSRYKHKQEEKQYRVYITDALMVIANNTARAFGGSTVTMRYLDIIQPQEPDPRTGDDIAVDLIQRAGLTFKKEE